MRAGYGISNAPYPFTRAMRDPYPITIAQTVNANNSYVSAGNFTTGIPGYATVAPVINTNGTAVLPLTAYTKTLPAGTFRRGYVESANATFERALPAGFDLTASYVLTQAIRQTIYFEANAGQTPGLGAAGQPLYTAFGRKAETQTILPSSSADYNALQLNLKHPFRHGVLVTTSYTYSKSIDLATDDDSVPLFNAVSYITRNRAVSDFNRTNVFDAGFTAELPFGKEHAFLHSPGLMSAIAGGWKINGVVSRYSGLPYTPIASATSLNAPFNTQVANQIKPHAATLNGIGKYKTWFDTSAFAPVTTASFGTASRNSLRGPAIQIWTSGFQDCSRLRNEFTSNCVARRSMLRILRTLPCQPTMRLPATSVKSHPHLAVRPMLVSCDSLENSTSNQEYGRLFRATGRTYPRRPGETKLIALDRRAFLGQAAASLISTRLFPLLLNQPDTEKHLTLPPWEPGYLYIHHISTGRGSCALLILPDATTLMIDAGSMITHYEPFQDKFMIDPRPNASLRPGQWIAKYAREHLSQAGRNEIDYFLLTHFHEDHMGTVWPERYDISPRSQFGPYQLGGITDVAETIPVLKVIDRCNPDYAYPAPIPGPQFANYHAFINTLPSRGGAIERFIPGLKKQITLKHAPERYPDFVIRNLASNGNVWTGVGDQTRAHFPPMEKLNQADYPTENKCALAIRLQYGGFSYFSAGDEDHEVEYGRWPRGDIETAVAQASGKVQVAVADHHGFKDACGPKWVRALQPKAFVINAWDSAHPTMISLDNMLSQELYSGPRLVFSTVPKPEVDITIRRMAEVASQNGHVIFRVPAGGKSFEVFVRDSSVPDGRITAHFGSIRCT